MSNDVTLHTFPESKLEALAMLYVQNQNVADLSPEELLDKYEEAYDKLRVHYKETRSERRTTGWSFK